MQGMNRTSGAPLEGVEHLRQSVNDILSTPLGSRRMLMSYGSNLFRLVDNPADRVTAIKVVMATAVALTKWEPRLQINSVEVLQAGAGGKISLLISGTDVETGRTVLLEDVGL